MKSESSEFWAAARKPAEIPRARGPEIALTGRSNGGKSTLINRLLGRRALARTSSTPGATRGLIFYRVGDDRMTLVDLPGYGWARRSAAEREAWGSLVEGYLAERSALAGVLMLIDVRRGAEDDERALAALLDEHRIPRVWALTKCDKLRRGELERRLRELAGTLDGPAVPVATGAEAGVEDLRNWIEAAVAEHRR